MQQTDNFAAQALQRFAHEEPGVDVVMEPKLRIGWARFIYSLILRTPEALQKMDVALKEEAEKVVDRYKSRYPEIRTPSDPETFEEFRKRFLANPFNTTMQPYLDRIIDSERVLTFIAEMQWGILDTWGAKDRLLTSDRPIIMTNGLAADDSHLVIPISPTHLFLAINKDHTRRHIMRMGKNELVRVSNQRVSEQARRFVYGFSDALLPVVSKFLGKMLPSSPLENMSQ
jgi:hypothetical protein